MSDVVKWALLVAGFLALIALILTLPVAKFFGSGAPTVSQGLAIIADLTSHYLYTARAFINIFLTGPGRKVLTGIIGYLFTRWIVLMGVKLTTWIYHFIFK